jgi:hypothetical protein
MTILPSREYIGQLAQADFPRRRKSRIRVARNDPAFLETYQKALATLAELPMKLTAP